MKSVEEFQELETFKSYTKIYSPEIEKTQFGEFVLIDKIFEMFLYASGQRFLPALTMAKFSKIAKFFRGVGNKQISKFDFDVCYKKMVTFHEQMDFYAFLDSIDFLLEKCFVKSKLEQDEKMRFLVENYERVKNMKKEPRRRTRRKEVDGRAMVAKGIYAGVREKKKRGSRKRGFI